MKAIITLVESASYSEPGRPSFVRGIPLTTTDESVIQWAKDAGRFDIQFPDDEPEPDGDAPEGKPAPKPVTKGKGKGKPTKRKKS